MSVSNIERIRYFVGFIFNGYYGFLPLMVLGLEKT